MLSKPLLIIDKYLVAYRKLILYEHDLANVVITRPKIQINVRKASLNDMEKLVEKSAHERRVNKEKYKRRVLERLKAGHWCFIAEKNSEILGYAWIALRELYVMEIERKMGFKEDEAMIYDVYTFSIHRGKGIAPKIYEEALHLLKKNDYKKVYIAILEENKPSQRAIEKLKFKVMETITFRKILGIKKLAYDKERETDDKRKEMTTRNNEAQIYDLQYSLYRKNIELIFTLKNFEVDKPELVLDAGAGTGRFTIEFAKTCAEVVAVDYSLESLKINKARCNSHAVLADLCYLPFRSSVFDRTVSIGVFQHIPTWKGRFEGLKEILRVSKKGTKFLVSVYNYRLKTGGLDRQGYHGNGSIYYYRFFFTEFRHMLLQVFPKILDLRGVLILSFLMERVYKKRLEKLVPIFEGLIEKTYLSLLLGSRLVAICET